MPDVCTIYDYMREFADHLDARILKEYPALQRFEDPVSPRVDELLRRIFRRKTSPSWRLPSAGNSFALL